MGVFGGAIVVELSVSRMVAVLSGLLLILLGLFVASIRPRRSGNLPFALWALGMGAGFLLINGAIFLRGGYDAVLVRRVEPFTEIFLALAAGAVVALGLRFPYRLQGRKRRLVVLPAIAAGLMVGAAAVAAGWMTPRSFDEAVRPDWLLALVGVQASILFSLHLMALRYASEPPTSRRVRAEYMLLSFALVLYPGYAAGAGYTGGTSLVSGDAAEVLVGMASIANLALLAGLWLWIAARHGGGRAAWLLAWLCLALPLFGMVDAARLGGVGFYGWARSLGVLVVGYGILRYQMLGIDLGVKWTVRHGTVAGAFGAGFFVAAELLEEIVQAGTFARGLVGAALITLVLFPLRRFANSLAERVLPGVEDSDAYRGGRREDSYRFALEVALENREISAQEEASLQALAQHLGLDARREARIRRAVERGGGRSAEGLKGGPSGLSRPGI